MQGLESLNQFQKFVSSLGGLGRFEDTYMIHAAEGETVVPMEVLDRNPVLKKRLFKSMKALGIDPGRYIVGNDLNSLNPVTGQPEFFFKKIVKRLKKAAGDIAGYAAPIAGAMYGPGVGAAVGAGLGAFKRENPGDPSQWAQMGMLGGASGIAANLAGGAKGMDILKGRGIQGAGGLEQFLKGRAADPGNITGARSATQGALGFGGDWGGGRVGDVFDKTLGTFKSVVPSSTDDGDGKFGGFDLKKLAIMFGLGTAGLGFLIDKTTSDEDIRIDRNLINQAKQVDASFANILEPATTDLSYASALTPYQAADGGIVGYESGGSTDRYILFKGSLRPLDPMPATAAKLKELGDRDYKQGTHYDIVPLKIILDQKKDGGIMDLQDGGFSQGPGTGTSDSIPAMLSDGEFVMTADAVRGAGGGDRREGARKMYEAMDRLEARV